MEDNSNSRSVADPQDFVNHELNSEENIDNGDNNQNDMVKYATYKKAVSQYKNLKPEFDKYKAYYEKAEEEKLQKKGEYDKLIQSRDERIKTLEEQISTYHKNEVESKKINSVVNKLPGKLKKNEYLSFFDLEAVNLDPESGEIDQVSLEREVDRFVKSYGTDFLDYGNQKGLPSVGHLGGKPNLKRRLKDLSDEELKKAYLNGEFNR